MIINHNIASMKSQGALFQNNRMLGKDLHKLSTGLRINNASDDAAGLAISEGLRTQIRGQEQAKRNALDGISGLNIAEGAMNEIHNILQRQSELAVQASTATYSNAERALIQEEFDKLDAEMARMMKVANFNGIKLLDNSADVESIFVVKTDKSAGLDNIANAYKELAKVIGSVENDVARQGLTANNNLVALKDLITAAVGNNFNKLNASTSPAATGGAVPSSLESAMAGISTFQTAVNTAASTAGIQANGLVGDGAANTTLIDGTITTQEKTAITAAVENLYAALSNFDKQTEGLMKEVKELTGTTLDYKGLAGALANADQTRVGVLLGNMTVAIGARTPSGADFASLEASMVSAFGANYDQFDGNAFVSLLDHMKTFKDNLRDDKNITDKEKEAITLAFDALNNKVNTLGAAAGYGTVGAHRGELWVDANGTRGVDSINVKFNVEDFKHGSNIMTQESAEKAITAIQKSIRSVSETRANIGSSVNRLESTVNNLTVSVANQQAAESQIRDLDFAYQSSQFTKNQILTQSATSMLTQANAVTQGALSLIRG